MANAIWCEQEKRWKIDEIVNGKRKVFISSKPGRAGKLEVNRKKREYQDATAEHASWGYDKCWELFIEDIKARSSRPNVRNTEGINRLYIKPQIKTSPAKMYKADWQSIINNAKGQSGPLSKKTLSNIRAVIVSFSRFCVDAGVIEVPVSGLYIPKSAHTVTKGILQPDALKRLFEPSKEWYINLWRFMAVTGLRTGEALGLQWGDIDNGVVTIQRSINNYNMITPGKNSNAQRTFVLHDISKSLLDDQKDKTKHLESEWVFCNTLGGKPCQTVEVKGWQRLKKEKNISEPPYSLRRTFISMTKNDLPPELLKAIVGHSASMDTFGIYGRRVDGELKQTAEIIDLTFKKVLKNQ